MGATYLYGIVCSGPQEASLTGVTGVRGGRVYTLPLDGLAAVIGPGDLSDYHGMRREELVRILLDHERVIEEVMRLCPVLPARFSTVLPHEDSVAELLARGGPDFRRALDELAGKAQTELLVQWNLEEVFAEIGQSEEIAGLRLVAQAASPEEAVAARVEVGRTVQALLARRRAAIAECLLPRLVDLARDSVVNVTQNDGIVLNVALLLDEEGRRRLDALLPELDAEFSGRLDFRAVGPLPPCSFATLEVETPRFAEIDAARRLLRLPDVVTAADVKAAYHRVASAVHPDLNPDAKEAAVRMSELSEAHTLLSHFVRCLTTPGPRPADRRSAARPTCSLTPAAVERALLFSIARSDAAAN